MTMRGGSRRRRIDPDGIHDLVTGRAAAAFYRRDIQVWVVQVADERALDDMLRQLGALGYRRDRDFTVQELTIHFDAEDITS